MSSTAADKGTRGPRIVVAAAVMVAMALLAASCKKATTPPVVLNGIVIEHATLISPERGEPLKNIDVVIRDGRIAAVGPDLGPTAGARRIDVRGRYLIPGLIDSHTHLGNPMALDDGAIDQHPELLTAYRAQVPRAYLAFGVTTVVDVDSKPETRAWFEASPLHPRLYHCGRAVRIVGGYGAQGVPADATSKEFPYLVYEPAQAAAWPATLNPEEHSPARVVERIAQAGGKCVKTFIESGFGVFDWPVPRPDTLVALRDEAKERGLTFIVHANSVDAWRAAIAAQADVIAHGLWHWPGKRLDSAPSDAVKAVIEAAAQAGVRVQPTLRVLQNDRSVFDWAIVDDPRMRWALPNAIRHYLRTQEALTVRRALAREYDAAAQNAGETSGAAALIAAANARVLATTRMMSSAHVRFVFGSDTPSGEGVGNPPGLNGRLELQQWADAGIPLLQILRAATVDNASAFGLDRDVGTIEVGKRADLLLLGRNPLEDVAAYDSIDTVFVNGEPVARTRLLAED
jgi:imidazolonepropionase-like amidohydrolase